MFPTGPIHVVAHGVDVLGVEGRGSGIDGTKLAIGAACGPAHVNYASGKTRHELRTRTTRQTDVSLGRAVVGAAEGEPHGIEHGRRENVILRQGDPLVSR